MYTVIYNDSRDCSETPSISPYYYSKRANAISYATNIVYEMGGTLFINFDNDGDIYKWSKFIPDENMLMKLNPREGASASAEPRLNLHFNDKDYLEFWDGNSDETRYWIKIVEIKKYI